MSTTQGATNPEETPVRSVIVVGRTGAGKSEMTKQLILSGADKENLTVPDTSAGFRSCTKFATVFDIPGTIGSAKYQLVDTMGLLDCQEQDEQGIEGLSKVLGSLMTTVGVIYVVTGKMDPSEIEICEFLFDTFFMDVSSNRILVLKTKCNDWEEYDCEKEKQQLRDLKRVPQRMIDARWTAADFSPYAPPDHIQEMTNRIRRHMASWTSPLKLSDKMNEKFVPGYKKVEEAQKALEQMKISQQNFDNQIRLLRDELSRANSRRRRCSIM